MSDEKWKKPFRKVGLHADKALSSTQHLSCWDCEHIRISFFPERMCVKHPRTHVYGVGPVDIELREEMDCGRDSTVADRCGDFQPDSDFAFLLPMREVRA